MTQKTVPHVVRQPDGTLAIPGCKVTLQQIYCWHELMGMSQHEIAARHLITIPQIRVALLYIRDHMPEIRESLHDCDDFMDQFMGG
jgi:hypothetical protein